MPRDIKAYLEDIKQSISEIESFTKDITNKNGFFENIAIVRAVERDIEIIGEAVKKIPEEIRSNSPEIPWQQIAGIRDILAHAYLSVDKEILWDVVRNQLVKLKTAIKSIEKDI